MNFSPMPFKEAIAYAQERGLLPTSLSSAELRSLEAEVRRRAVFSARTTNAAYLQELKDAITRAVSPQVESGKLTDLATIRAELQDKLLSLGYDSEAGGFPEDLDIPPAERGSLKDLASTARLKLVTETQVRQAFGFGQYKQGLSGAAANSFPCWELVRIYPRRIERGFKPGPKGTIVEDPDNDWPARWSAAGGDFYDGGRMIAPKDSDVWQNLGDGMGGYDDTLGNPYPPFAFNSGMGVEEIDREEALRLGVIEEGDEVATDDVAFNEGLEVNAEQFDEDFLKALQGDLEAALENSKSEARNPQLIRNRLAFLVGGAE